MRSRYFIFLPLEVSPSRSNPTIKMVVIARIDDTSNVCTDADAMDNYDGPIPLSGEDSDNSLETRPPSPKVSDSDSPPAKPARSADVPPNSASRTPIYYDGLSNQLAQK
jgi:hypothetical protein